MVDGLQGVGLVVGGVGLGLVVTDHHLLTPGLQHAAAM